MASEALVSTDSTLTSRQWFALLAAPCAWALQGLLGWFVASSGCGHAISMPRWLSDAGVRGAETIITAGALLLALAGVRVAFAAWRAFSQPNATPMQGRGRMEFIATAALLISLVFTLGIVWAGIPTFILPACEAIR